MATIDTKTLVKYDLFDRTAADDATCTSGASQPFSDTSKLTVGTNFGNYGTLERNSFVLDGTMDIFDHNDTISFFSNEMSNSRGEFNHNPSIDIQFTENHSSVAIGLYFADDFPQECVVTWKTLRGNVLQRRTFSITSSYAILDYPVTNYGGIVIEFTKTSPNRYVKLNKIEFGKSMTWDETTIMSCSLVEEIDLTGETMPISTITFKILDEDDLCNIGNSNGYHQYVQKGQQILPYVVINGVATYLGKYYVTSLSESNNSATFKCEDVIKRLDGITFYKGDVYSKAIAGPIIESILQTAGITDYFIEDDVYNSVISGAISPMSCRNALAKITFATMSLVSTKRSDTLYFYKDSKAVAHTIGRDRKISTKATKRDYVSGVSLTYDKYTLSSEEKDIVTEQYPVGSTLITFDSPYTNVTASVGNILESGKYYCILSLTESQEVTISGNPYDKSEITSSVSINALDSGESENVKEYRGVLADADTATVIGESLLKYLQYRLELDIKYLANEEILSSWCIVKNPISSYNDYIAGITSITTDLVGGFVADAKLVGYYDYSDFNYFAGNELITPDNFIL